MIRYIIEKFINYDYGHGYETISEKGRVKTFSSIKSAFEWLIYNDKDCATLSKEEIAKLYNIKPYIV